MQVTVHLTREFASSLRQSTEEKASSRGRVASIFKKLKPLHRATDDPELFKHFYLTVSDEREAQEMIEKLVRQPGVEAAYVKPAEGPP